MTQDEKAEKKSPIETPEIKAQRERVDELKKQIEAAERELLRMILAGQGVCGHVGHKFVKVMQWDESYRSLHDAHFGHDVFIGSRCAKCTLFVPRIRGFPWQVCYMCGNKMDHVATIPGQGERVRAYKCENANCGHEYGIT